MESLKRWLYRENRPHFIAQVLNKFWGVVHSSGMGLDTWVTLEIIGRKSGRVISLPVVAAPFDGQRYLVSMLGNDAQWVKNVRAANGKAYIRRGHRISVRLEEVPEAESAPILKAYLQYAPGARPHIPVNKDAPLAEFETIKGLFPVFRIIEEVE